MTKLADLVSEFLLYLSSVRGLSENTVTAYTNDLSQFQRMPSIEPKSENVSQITTEDLRLCIGVLSKRKRSAPSINRFLASVRTFFAYLKKMGHIEINPASELKTVKMSKVLPHFMTEEEVNKICAQPQVSELLWQKRDTAIVEMLYCSGCRISELKNLRFCDFKENFSKAVVHGKGGKDRFVYFDDVAKKALKEYLDDRKVRFNMAENFLPKDFIFVNQRNTPISVKGLYFIISKYSGIEGTNHHINPHAFRHTFATKMLSEGADVRVVQELLGHSSISTTQRYTHITTDALIDTYRKAHPHG